MRKHWMKLTAVSLSVILTMGLFTGCGGAGDKKEDGKKVFYYGDTTFNAENDESDVNPHRGYSGWACIRYGIGETLFRYSDSMELEPWLAKSYELVDETTWKITLNEGITFTSGRALDGAAVKECLEHLIANHERAKGDLKIKEIKAEGQVVTIITEVPVPALMNYLSDPYGCIIDIAAGITEEGNVSGTGPYKATKVETNQGLTLVKNEIYWNGTPKLDEIQVRTITDGDTLTMALQSKELDAAYGLPYASLPLFAGSDYQISSCETSRSFFGQFNFKTKALQEDGVRKAISMAIDKEGFTSVLLQGNGSPAVGPFPASFSFGDDTVIGEAYNLEEARKLLADCGWKDTDGNGYVDKEGEDLTIRWLTYPSRQELPLLAESVQATLKEIGIKVQINCTANHLEFVQKGEWDIYASAFVCAPTGDPEYFFTTHCLKDSSKNRGGYESEALEALAGKMRTTFDQAERGALATEMTNQILADHAFVFASHLRMSIVSKAGVTGLVAHPCDYYEITVELDK